MLVPMQFQDVPHIILYRSCNQKILKIYLLSDTAQAQAFCHPERTEFSGLVCKAASKYYLTKTTFNTGSRKLRYDQKSAIAAANELLH
jgi:hypothetical protein